MSLTTRVLLGLAAGLAVGILLSILGNPSLVAAAGWIEPVGTLWVNALRMTIVPLVVAGLIVGAASAREARAIGRLGLRALVIFLVLVAAAAAFAVVVAPPLLGWLPISPEAAAALRNSAAATAPDLARTGAVLDLRQWLIDLVPTNAFAAAVNGAILPLIVFALATGFAVSRIAAAERRAVVSVFRGIFDAMLTLVRWILELAPIGVFALALPLATRMGVAAAGAVVYYIVVVSVLLVLFVVALYPVAATVGRARLRAFARGVAPAQAVALSSRSSLASLPAMIDGGQKHLDFPETITSFFLPLAASMFRSGSAIGIPGGVLFIAHLYGVPLGPLQLLTVAITSALITFSVPGVPGGSILIMVPVLQAVGLPAAGVGILLGVDTIPDMFRTMANVTGTMTAATILREDAGAAEAPLSAIEVASDASA